jgi:YaiO family outer membrane protein
MAREGRSKCRIGGILIALALSTLPLHAQTKTRPVDVIAKPAAPGEPLNKIWLNYEYQHFNQDFAAWNWWSLEYSHRFDWGALVGRVNWADRFDQTASQYEVDAYPHLWKGAYLYLNYGVSGQDTFFPSRKYGAELYFSLPKQFEASVGVRRLEYSVSDVWLYTGSIGWYRGNWYMSFRPWVSNKPGDTSVSASFMARRYLATKDDYWTLRVGGGQSSEVDQSIDSLLLSSQWYVIGEWQKKFRPLWILTTKAGVGAQSFETGVTRDTWLVGAGIARIW